MKQQFQKRIIISNILFKIPETSMKNFSSILLINLGHFEYLLTTKNKQIIKEVNL